MLNYSPSRRDIVAQLIASFTVVFPAITIYRLAKGAFSIESSIHVAILFAIVFLLTVGEFGLRTAVICTVGGIVIGGIALITVLFASEIWLMYLAMAMWSYTTVVKLRSKETAMDCDK